MIAININIGGEEKNISTSTQSTHSQEVLPSPILQNFIDITCSGVPSPQNTDNSIDSTKSSSAPHPTGFASSISAGINQMPGPMIVGIQSSSADVKVPKSMESEEFGSASQATKSKPRTTKRKYRFK